MNGKKSRKNNGLTEFGVVMSVLIFLVIVPFVSMSFIPVRYLIAQLMLSDLTHRMSLCEKRTEAYQMLNDPSWRDKLALFGVKSENQSLRLYIYDGQSTALNEVLQTNVVPDSWLPGSKRSSCIYSLKLDIDADIYPAVGGEAGIPGLTTFIRIPLHASSNWESLGRDPNTGKFYIDE